MSPASPLQIAQVVFSLQPGGMENGVVNLSNGLPDSAARTTFLCLEEAGAFAARLRPGIAVQAEIERLILAVAAGHHKRTMFTIAERLEIATELAKPCGNVEVIAFRGLLSDFVQQNQGRVVVRGLRAVSDFEYEFQMAGMNRQLMPEVETLFLTPSDQYQFVSGTFVREIATLGGDVSKFVAPSVLARLKERVARPPTEE